MEVITYKKQTSKTKYIIEAALEYRPPLNISRNFFSEKKKIKAAASIQENTITYFILKLYDAGIIGWRRLKEGKAYFNLKGIIHIKFHKVLLFSYLCLPSKHFNVVSTLLFD